MKGLIIIGSAQIGSHTNALSKYLKGQLGEQHKQLMKLKTMSNLYRVKQWKQIS